MGTRLECFQKKKNRNEVEGGNNSARAGYVTPSFLIDD